ncbi:MAG: hypothetical protein ABR909_13085 [Candidatus Bathyarchaeia archaeon]|jgi:hypothetical protein
MVLADLRLLEVSLILSIVIVICSGELVLPTTVQVDEKTLQMLNKIKKEMNASSHDQVIKTLILERKKIPCSMFGSNRKLKPFSGRDEAEFHDL